MNRPSKHADPAAEANSNAAPMENARERALQLEVERLRRELVEAEHTRSQIRQSLDETLDIRHLAADLLTCPDAAAAGKRLIELTRSIITFDWAAVFLYEEKFNDFVSMTVQGAPPDLLDIVRYQTSQGIIDWVIGEGRPIVIPDMIDENSEEDGRHLVIVPLMAGNRGIGVLELCSSTPRDGYTSHQMELAAILASQAAVMIDNARLRESMAEKIREMSSVFEIGRTLTSALAVEDLLGLIVSETLANTQADLGCAHLVEPVSRELVPSIARSGAGGRLTGTGPGHAATRIASLVMEAKHAILVPDVALDPRFADTPSDNGQSCSLLSLPMIENDEVVGVITLEKAARDGEFASSDVELLSSFARQAAVAVRLSRLYGEQAEKERQLKESQAELLRASKLAAIGLLAAGVAHEINNPLQVILGLTQLLLRQLSEEPDCTRDLKTIERETIRTAEIVSQLLKSCRRLGNKGEIEKVDVNALLHEATRLMSHQLELSEVSLLIRFDPGLSEVFGNSGELEQVFLNMMTNAEQAMPDGGTLEVSTKALGAYIEVSFKDTGKGIPVEFLDNIFDPFFTTKPTGKGTGLGLFICHSVIEKHEGSIQVTSTPGEGTCFSILLPVADGKSAPPENTAVVSGKGVEV